MLVQTDYSDCSSYSYNDIHSSALWKIQNEKEYEYTTKNIKLCQKYVSQPLRSFV